MVGGIDMRLTEEELNNIISKTGYKVREEVKVKIIEQPEQQPEQKKSKYKNVKTTVDGIKFDSKKEAERYRELKMLEDKGEIDDLRLQDKFCIQNAYTSTYGERIRAICYIADFTYFASRVSGKRTIEDCKGKRTKEFNMKWKLMKAIFPNFEYKLT
jgi:hypothetical protein